MNEMSQSGIGRRRGAGNKKSAKMSITVGASVFFLVLLVIIVGFKMSFIASSVQTTGLSDKIREEQGIHFVEDENKGGWEEQTRSFLKKRHGGQGGHKHERHERAPPREHLLRSHEHERAEAKGGVASPQEAEDKWGPILRGEVHLIDIIVKNFDGSSNSVGYEGVKAQFCKLNWDLHKNDPPSYPMFRFLVSSSGCGKSAMKISVDMATLMEKAREYDKLMDERSLSENLNDIDGYVHAMPPKGFVFHESRVGSTLVANSLAAMNPQVHRVYSESNPINEALRVCDDVGPSCDMDANVKLFRDVVYIMGRTNSPNEQNMFFKVSSAGTKRLGIMQQAFPTTPWVFVYRNPVQTMMSHLDPSKIGNKTKGINAVCTRAKRNPPKDLRDLVFESSGKEIREITDIEFCAAHLVSGLLWYY